MCVLKGYLLRIHWLYVIDLQDQVRSQNSYPYHYRISHLAESRKDKEKIRSKSRYLSLKRNDHIFFHMIRDNFYHVSRCIWCYAEGEIISICSVFGVRIIRDLRLSPSSNCSSHCPFNDAVSLFLELHRANQSQTRIVNDEISSRILTGLSWV